MIKNTSHYIRMKSLSQCITESLVLENNDLWKTYTYVLKNMPKIIPFKDDQKVTEEDLVRYYKKYFADNANLSYDDVNGNGLIPFEQYVLSNFDDIRLLNMLLSYNHSNSITTLTIEYGPTSIHRKSKGTIAKKESYEFNIKTSDNKVVDSKKWVHAIVTFLENNITNLGI